MSDGQSTPDNLAGYFDNVIANLPVSDLQETQEEPEDINVKLDLILQNQAAIINNQNVMAGQLNSIGQILDYMGQTVQNVAKTFQSGGGVKGLMGMLGGSQNNG